MSAIKWKVGGSSSQEANISWLSWLYSTPPSGGLWYIKQSCCRRMTSFSKYQEWHCAFACCSALRAIRLHFPIDKAPEEFSNFLYVNNRQGQKGLSNHLTAVSESSSPLLTCRSPTLTCAETSDVWIIREHNVVSYLYYKVACRLSTQLVLQTRCLHRLHAVGRPSFYRLGHSDGLRFDFGGAGAVCDKDTRRLSPCLGAVWTI